jgi:hypothetical protein
MDHGRLSRERSGRDVEPPRQSMSTYVQLFNEGGLEKLLDKKTPPGKSPYLAEEQQKKLKQHDFTQHSFRTKIGNGCFLEYSYHSILPSKSIRDFHDKGMGE